MLNNKGPKIEPCGTPVVISVRSDSRTSTYSFTTKRDLKFQTVKNICSK